MKTLLVDADFVSRMLLQRALEIYGTVDVATNATEGLAAFEFAIKQTRPYQLVCLDIGMSDDNGQVVLKAMRHQEEALTVPEELRARVVMTSGHAVADQVRTAFHNRSDSFLAKPVDVARLKKVLFRFGLIDH